MPLQPLTMEIKTLADCAVFLGNVSGRMDFLSGVVRVSVGTGATAVVLSVSNWQNRLAKDIVTTYLVPACLSLQKELSEGSDASESMPEPYGQIPLNQDTQPEGTDRHLAGFGPIPKGALDAEPEEHVARRTTPFLAKNEKPPTQDPSQAKGSPAQPTS